MRRDALLVEFLGLPGVGKSELSRRVAAELEQRGLAVGQPSYGLAHGIGSGARRLRKSALVASEAALHPAASWRAARVLARSGQPSRACLGGLVFNWLLVSAIARRARRRGGLHLIDEGLAQAAWSVGLEGRVEPALGLLGALPRELRPDLVLVVQASSAAVTQRLRSRPEHDSRLDSRLDSEPTLLDRGRELVSLIRIALESASGAKNTLLVRNERRDDLDIAAARLAVVLQSAARDAGLDETRPPAVERASASS